MAARQRRIPLSGNRIRPPPSTRGHKICVISAQIEFLGGTGPIPAIHGVVRWRLKDLVEWIWEEFRIALDETTVGRELNGYSLLTRRGLWLLCATRIMLQCGMADSVSGAAQY